MVNFATTKVVVKQGPFAKFAVWATFAVETDAHEYSDKLRRQHLTWTIEVRYPYVNYSKVI